MWKLFHINKNIVDKITNNNNSIIERIKLIIENESISVRAFEDKINVSQGAINKAIQTGSDVKGSVINKIVDVFPHYDALWILRGESEMIKKSPENLSYNNTNELRMIRELSEELALVKKELSDLKNAQTKKPHTTTYNVAASAELSEKYSKKHSQNH